MAKTQHNQNAPLVDDYQEPERPEASDINEASDHPRFDEGMNANMQKRDEGETTLEQDAQPRDHEEDPSEPNRQTKDRPLDPEADRRRLKTEALRKRDGAVDRFQEKQELAQAEQDELKERNEKHDTRKASERKKLIEKQREDRKEL